MPVSTFFDFYKNRQEQSLVEDLVNESINIFGFNGYYIPRDDSVVDDLLYGDSPLKKFSSAYPLAMRLSNQVDPGMNADFFSKFGLEIQNNIRIEFSRREFSKRVPRDSYNRPEEGDLIYIPHLSGTGELYEIKYCNDSVDKFALGREMPYYWELELELFKYNNEDLDTGVEEIDDVELDNAFAVQYTLTVGSGDYLVNETVYQGDSISPDSFGTVKSWNHQSKLLTLVNINGIMQNDVSIVGSDSGASYINSSFDELDNPQTENSWDNKVIENESEDFIDTTENNPFGIL